LITITIKPALALLALLLAAQGSLASLHAAKRGPLFIEPCKWHSLAVEIRWSRNADGRDMLFLDVMTEVLSPKDREALKGASNGGYHYFGSAKIFAQMGKAFAEALLPFQK
jgi:hypothetical protein